MLSPGSRRAMRRRAFLLGALAALPAAALQACGGAVPATAPPSVASSPTAAPATSAPAAPPTGAAPAAKPATTPAAAATPAGAGSGAAMPTVVRQAGTPLKGTLEVYAGAYLPNVPRGEGVKPLVEPQKVADAWRDKHPGVAIKWREGPPDGKFDEWALAQIVGGTAPDIMPQGLGEFQAQSELKAWFVDLEPALKLPSAYVPAGAPGSDRWENLFHAQAWLQRGTSTGKRTYLPLDLDTTAFYYNQTIFDKVGVDFAKVADYAAMLDAFKQVKEAGFIPTLVNFSAASNQTWWLRLIRSQINEAKLFTEIDVSKDQNITQDEWSRAIRAGAWEATQDYWWEGWRILQLLEPYQQQGYLASYDFTLFTGGRVATVFDGNWNLTKIADDPRRTFEYGVRNVPPVTRATSPLAKEAVPPEAVRTLGGGFGATLAITAQAMQRGTGEAALDFLQWFTAPQNFGPMNTEYASRTPNIKGVPPTPRMAPFDKLNKDTAEYADPWTKLVQSYRDGMVKLAQQLYSKQIDQKAFQQQVQAAQTAAANELCDKFKWGHCT